MDQITAKQILLCLICGANPATGEVLPQDHVIYAPQVHEALRIALENLQRKTDDIPAKPWWNTPEETRECKTGGPHADCPWREENDEQQLPPAEQRTSAEGKAQILGRRAREELLCGTGNGKRGQAWSEQDEETLRRMRQEGCSTKEIARELQRSAFAIVCRLKKLGLEVREETAH